MPIIGAKSAIRIIMVVVCCIVCISFVDLVISDAVEKRFISVALNSVTRVKSALRMFLHIRAAENAAKKLPATAHSMDAAETIIIMLPMLLT